MKKICLIILSLIVVCLAFSSCKSTKNCPAYGKVVETNIEQKA